MSDLTQARVRELLDYDRVTGLFRWRSSRGSVAAGSTAGRKFQNGYISVKIDGCDYYAHRLAVLWMTGKWPAFDTDHRDLDRGNNAWHNLREATRSQNNGNTRKAKRNTTGFKGVTREASGNYCAKIQFGGKSIRLGTFATAEAAHSAYVAASEKAFGEFGRSE